jgi:hypothetical protein
MSNEREVLDEALAALRDATAKAPGETVSATRRAILIRAAGRRRRFAVGRLVLPFAALFGVGVAWAAATHRLPAIFGSKESEAPAPPPEPPPVVKSPIPPPPPRAPALPSVPASAPVAAVETSPSANLPTTRASADAEPSEALYRSAHEAHFVAHDWVRALAGWDAYLARAPKGRFAPEARYNRALALIRLGRRDEAREALAPFAAGAYEGYRQSEAKELLDALE